MMNANEQFIVKHYSEDERPMLKGHGFDGLTIGDDRQEAQEFVDYLNTMLRQQQEKLNKYELRHAEQRKRIDELEAYQKHDVELAEAIGWDKGYEAGRQLGMKQERALWELAASTQEIMDTHPVKEQDVKYNVTVKWDDKITHHKNVSVDTPLYYTHPVKELTDEKITEVYKKVILHDRNSWHEFARAILRKAQE